MINSILSGQVKTLLNNAVQQSSAPKDNPWLKGLSAPQVQAPQPSTAPKLAAPPISIPNLSKAPNFAEQAFKQPNMQDVALIYGAGEKAGKVAGSAGFEYKNLPDPQTDPQAYFKAVNQQSEETLKQLGIEKDKATTEIIRVSKEISNVYNSKTMDELQTKLLAIIEKGQPKQQFTSARDFFIETDKSGKERLSNRGVATLTLAALAGLFGNPTQTSQTSQLVMGLGDKYAKEKNLYNEAKFRADLNDYNRQIQNVQTGISIEQQKQQKQLKPLEMEYATWIKQIDKIDELTADEKKSAKEFANKMATIAATANTTDRKQLRDFAFKGLVSDDPNIRVNSYWTLTSLGIYVDPPFTYTKEGKMEIIPTIGQKTKEAALQKTQEATKKIIQDTQAVIDKAKRDDEKLKLEKEKFEFDKKYKDNLIKLRKAMVSIAGKNASSYATFTAQQKSALQFSQQFAKDEITKLDKSIATAEKNVSELDDTINNVAVIEDPKLRETMKANAIKARDAAKQKLDGLKKERTERVNDFTKINKFINIPGQGRTGANTNTRLPGRLPAPDIQPMTVNAKSYGLPEGVPAFVNPQFFPRVASKKTKGRNA